ncbi:MAG TPA: adenylate/guanylate cyclase domain-containing protein [Microthrixaceae bacterium]|nr:AAA family ATPase [Microthrixaceae bacterium]HNI34287.1 adenylate/guanylate cyclase domain-containing protein [Microthrixaceae bacterium]
MEGPPQLTGTVSFLFTDIVGSTAAWEAQPDAMAVAVARLEAILDDVGAAGRRVIEQGAGDSAVLAFERPSDAVAAAVALQRAMAYERWATIQPLRVRVALHLGEVDLGVDGTYRGATMNRCGRLLATAHGDQVVASGSFVAVLEESGSAVSTVGADDASWIDLGTHTLNGLRAPMAIWQLAHPDLVADFPALRTPEGRGLDLPIPTTELLGRADEMARLGELLGASRVVTILGPGGSGKTRLALEVAHAMLGEDREVGWVDLARTGQRDDVAQAVAEALSIRDGPTDPRRRIVEHLRRRRKLLVLDNCEHLLSPVADLVGAVTSRCPGVTVLATSREPLELQAEALLRLGPLGLPASPDGSDLLESAAGRLLADRVERVRHGGLDRPEDRAAAVQICRRLDGIPLALELAAARARSLPLTALSERLGAHFSLLLGGSRTALARQRTLEASVAWSYELLEEPDRATLRQLATFSGPFDVEAAAAVLDVGTRDPLDDVVSLVDKSLLLEERDTANVQYRMLETVRYFCRDRSVETGEASRLRNRHAAWVRSTVQSWSAAFEGPDSVSAVRRTDGIVEEVRSALDWARASGDLHTQVQIATDLAWYWVWRGLAGEGLEWLGDVELSDGAVSAVLEPRARFALHMLHAHHRPTHELIERFAREAIDSAIRTGDRAVEGRSRLLRATHRSFHDPVFAETEIRAAAEICRENAGPFWSVMADAHIAQLSLFRMLFRDADDLIAKVEKAASELGNHQLAVESKARRVAIAEGLGDNDGAIAALSDLDAVIDGISTREFRGYAVASVLWVQLRRGDAEGVAARAAEAIAAYVEDEDLQFVPLFVAPRAAALVAMGCAEQACTEMAPVWEHPEVQASKVYSIILTPPFAASHWMSGRRDRARQIATDALAVATQLGSPPMHAELEAMLAAFDLDAGLPAAAEPRLHRAVETLAQHSQRPRLCDALEELAHVELDFGRPAAAAVLLGAVSRQRAAEGVVLRPWRQAVYETIVRSTREVLGEDEADRRWSAGGELDLGEAVAFARRGRGERSRPTFGWDGLTATELRVAELVAQGLTNPQVADAWSWVVRPSRATSLRCCASSGSATAPSSPERSTSSRADRERPIGCPGCSERRVRAQVA